MENYSDNDKAMMNKLEEECRFVIEDKFFKKLRKDDAVRYILRKKDGSLNFMYGGKINFVAEDYMMIGNGKGVAWPVRFENVEKVYLY